MNAHFSPAWQELLATQSHVVSRSQAVEHGLAEAAIDNRLRAGPWRAIHRSVYATFTGELSRDALLWAAVLRAGPGAALSHQTAAELIGLTDEPSKVIHITVPLDRHPEPIQGAVVHRSIRISEATHPVRLPPRTRIEETVIDLTQAGPRLDDACSWMSRAVGRRLTTAGHLRRAMDDRANVRWRSDLNVILDDIDRGAHSLLEHRYTTLRGSTGDSRSAPEPWCTSHHTPLRHRLHHQRAAPA